MPTPKPADPIRDRRYINNIKARLKEENPLGYFLLIVGINSGLRVSDLLKLQVGDLWDEDGKSLKEFSIRAQKTGSLAITQINKAIGDAMEVATKKRAVPIHDLSQPLFPVTRKTVSKWVKQWCHEAGIDRGSYSAHSLRKTFAYQLWLHQGKTDEALIIVSKALGHKNTGTTMDYLGIRREQIAEWQSQMNL